MEELDQHYVFVKIDISRDEHGDTLCTRLKESQEGGVPWYAILDGEGKVLISSDAPELKDEAGIASIGYPTSPGAVDHFMKMLEQTAPRLSADRLARVRKALTEKK